LEYKPFCVQSLLTNADVCEEVEGRTGMKKEWTPVDMGREGGDGKRRLYRLCPCFNVSHPDVFI
jgi:hypothetical protein